ncbi:molybdenum cofactor guanylyltransferase [Rathayibacter sp. AY1B5]|uniref:molybdenum cofactor guanylyltransferase n=1 Tax=Rathayibacter sp. AY1B5 TaxID=2080530 RepID=UPI0015E40EAF|nr:NTP transferase domain-containing protein [Rathayibacter sp. AY1B5]
MHPPPPLPRFDAVVLAGGRASRLGGAVKPLLRHRESTLLGAALAAVRGAERRVVAGPPSLAAAVDGAELVQEDPPFGGPVAGISSALPLLERAGAPEWVVVLAADLVAPGPAVRLLLEEAASAVEDSLLAVDDDGRPQQLLGVHRRSALVDALAALGDPDGASARVLLRDLSVRLVAVPAGTTDDVDAPADALRHGIDLPGPRGAD